MKIALVTGSAGLIGSQACNFFSGEGYKIIGIDNDMRAYFFGEDSSTKDSLESLKSKINDYEHYNIDIRDYEKLNQIFSKYSNDIDIVIHTAAQPSHDWAANEPLTDFSINATGTINMLEVTRLNCPKATFIFTSTNKVYGDTPNKSSYIQERESRWECVTQHLLMKQCLLIILNILSLVHPKFLLMLCVKSMVNTLV